MTFGLPLNTSNATGVLSRKVSTLNLLSTDNNENVLNEFEARKRPRLTSLIIRQVSEDGLAAISDNEDDMHNSKVTKVQECSAKCCGEAFVKSNEPKKCSVEWNLGTDRIPYFPNPLRNPKLLERHIYALKLEANLHPMRLILSRLIAHPTSNRKGIFNSPVDPVKLGLIDYFEIIKQPMDLGTIKAKLHGVEYKSRHDVARDIRLVFDNSMKYNPPMNAVHEAAKKLLAFFEEQVQAFVPELALSSTVREVDGVVSAVNFTSDSASSSNMKASLVDEICSGEKISHENQNDFFDNHIADINVKRRKKRGSRVDVGHVCNRCEGKTCLICHQGCIPLETTLLVCNGANCAGARICKGAVYFISTDGGRQFCQRCHTGLPAVLPPSGNDSTVRYKRDLLKRKNDEESVERWLSCAQCQGAVHTICVMHDEFAHVEDEYLCPSCQSLAEDDLTSKPSTDEIFTFVSGSEETLCMSEFVTQSNVVLSADSLPECELSKFIQVKVRDCIKKADCPNAERTVHVRVIADCDRHFCVPEVIRNHFRMPTKDQVLTTSPPLKVNYRSRAIALFQKIDGLDVCIFCMYVHEYDGNDEYEQNFHYSFTPVHKKRVYIAYIDSVEHFRPRSCRTSVYREMIVSYLAAVRKTGYETAHIWACPPSRGNSFVFWNHPASQRTPSQQHLTSWYHETLSYAISRGIVTDVKSFYESEFGYQFGDMDDDPEHVSENVLGRLYCPPLFDGDFWIEEAVRIHNVHMSRFFKTNCNILEPSIASLRALDLLYEHCPALQIAAFIRDRIIAHPSSLPFRRPVNAAALKLADYHQIITKPMDIGTIYSRCVFGEYLTLKEVVADFELVVANAQRYNPVGHIVHTKAFEIRELFFDGLAEVVAFWRRDESESSMGNQSWEDYLNMRMSLDETFELSNTRTSVEVDGILQVTSEGCNEFCGAASFVSDTLSAAAKSKEHTHDLIDKGPDAIQRRMVGKDIWLLEKTSTSSKTCKIAIKKQTTKKRQGTSDSVDESATKRRQSWLGVEVAASVRKMRSYLFTCSLLPSSVMSAIESDKQKIYDSYVDSYLIPDVNEVKVSKIADARHVLFEFLQYRNLEFDTLRHAKYSTTVLLYHLHHENAPGTVPVCTDCCSRIKDVRWHKMQRVELRRRGTTSSLTKEQANSYEELCNKCYSKQEKQDTYVPIQVSLPVL